MITESARQAYLEVVGALPVDFGGDALDLRPRTSADFSDEAMILAAPDDLIQLRHAVERVTGPMTWPLRSRADLGDGAPRPHVLVATHRNDIAIERPAQLMGLVMALDDQLTDNSAAWRTRKTLREALGASLGSVTTVTTVAYRFESA